MDSINYWNLIIIIKSRLRENFQFFGPCKRPVSMELKCSYSPGIDLLNTECEQNPSLKISRSTIHGHATFSRTLCIRENKKRRTKQMLHTNTQLLFVFFMKLPHIQEISMHQKEIFHRWPHWINVINAEAQQVIHEFYSNSHFPKFTGIKKWTSHSNRFVFWVEPLKRDRQFRKLGVQSRIHEPCFLLPWLARL